MLTHLKIYCQSIWFETRDAKLANLLEEFLSKYYTVRQGNFGGNSGEKETVFVSKMKDHPVWFLHRIQFAHFIQYLKELNYPLQNYSTEDLRQYTIVKEDYRVRPQWSLRDDQKPVYDFLLDKPTGVKLVPVNTGVGKTTISLCAIAALKSRLGIIIPNQFVEKWVSDIQSVHEADAKDVMSVQGYREVAAIVAMAKANTLTSKYFIFSDRTISRFITQFEEDPELCIEMYGCQPAELFPILGIGVLLIDETHMAFHAVYKTVLHTNVQYQIGLSATLMSEDTVVSRAHKIMYPTANTYGDQMIQKYMDIYAISYNIPEQYLRKIKTSNRGSNSYSHIAFEQSILKVPSFFTDYVRIIVTTIEDYFIQEKRDKDKLIIFVATVEMATRLQKELEGLYPSENVVRYCEEDSYDDMLKGTIIVTTVISAGTGLDIPDLRVGLQTVSVSSPVSNIQTAGRLRKLKDRDVKFCYIYCPAIQKQRMYHHKRMEIFKNRAANYVHRLSRVGFR